MEQFALLLRVMSERIYSTTIPSDGRKVIDIYDAHEWLAQYARLLEQCQTLPQFFATLDAHKIVR